MKGLSSAFSFLTILPLPGDEEGLRGSIPFFPVVGLFLGGILVGIDRGLGGYMSPYLLSLFLLLILAIMTRAIHMDGFIDLWDALLSGKGREERLRIMRDSRTGAFGVIALFFLLALKLILVAELEGASRPPSLLLFPAIGRWAMTLSIFAFPYAREEGKGRVFKEGASLRAFLASTGIALLPSALFLGAEGITIMGGVGIFTLLSGRIIKGKLGGLTGDSYGAINEMAELLFILLAVFLRMEGGVIRWAGLCS